MADFSPLAARTRSHHAPVGPSTFDCVRVIVVRAGSAFLLSEFGTRHVKVGDVVLLDAHTRCGAEPEGSVTTTTIYLDREFMIDQMFWQYAAQVCNRHHAREFFDTRYATPVQVFQIGEDRVWKLTPKLDELAALSLNGLRPERFLRAQALLFSVLDVIEPFLGRIANASSAGPGCAAIPTDPRHRLFKPLRSEAHRVAQLIQGDPARRWTLRELAEAAHLSPSQLRRVFVGAFGKAPITYQTMVRIDRMANLLRVTVLPVKQIATQVGWFDADFAAHQFRRRIGVSPSRYRQLHHASSSRDAPQTFQGRASMVDAECL